MDLMRWSRLLGVVALVALMGGLTACNTVQGAGEDLQSAGEAVEDTAEDAAN